MSNLDLEKYASEAVEGYNKEVEVNPALYYAKKWGKGYGALGAFGGAVSGYLRPGGSPATALAGAAIGAGALGVPAAGLGAMRGALGNNKVFFDKEKGQYIEEAQPKHTNRVKQAGESYYDNLPIKQTFAPTMDKEHASRELEYLKTQEAADYYKKLDKINDRVSMGIGTLSATALGAAHGASTGHTAVGAAAGLGVGALSSYAVTKGLRAAFGPTLNTRTSLVQDRYDKLK